MAIRKYKDADFIQVAGIYNACKKDEWMFEPIHPSLIPLSDDTKRLAELLESDIYVYEETNTKTQTDHEIKGYVAFYGDELRSLYVMSCERGQGIGQGLLLYALELMTGKVTLNVVKSNTPSQLLYQKFGFKDVAEFEVNYNGVQIVVNRMLKT